MRMVDILSSIPWLVLVIVLSVFLRPGLRTIIIVIGGFSWMNIARLVRGETLSLKNVIMSYMLSLLVKKQQNHLPTYFSFSLTYFNCCGDNKYFGAIMTESALSF